MFRFTIRDVLWLTVVVGLAIVLWLEHSQLTALRETLNEQDAKRRITNFASVNYAAAQSLRQPP